MAVKYVKMTDSVYKHTLIAFTISKLCILENRTFLKKSFYLDIKSFKNILNTNYSLKHHSYDI